MRNYEVFWKEKCIGNLYIDGDKYRYIPHSEAIEELKGEAFLMKEATTGYEGKPIPFFKQMIDNCTRFEGREISYHHNNYSLKLNK